MDALLRYFYFFWWTTEHGVRKVERCMAKLARAPHTHHDDTTGPECGDCKRYYDGGTIYLARLRLASHSRTFLAAVAHCVIVSPPVSTDTVEAGIHAFEPHLISLQT